MIHSQKLGQNGAQIAHGKLLLPEEWIIDVEKRVLLKVSGKVDKQETERERERERERIVKAARHRQLYFRTCGACPGRALS